MWLLLVVVMLLLRMHRGRRLTVVVMHLLLRVWGRIACWLRWWGRVRGGSPSHGLGNQHRLLMMLLRSWLVVCDSHGLKGEWVNCSCGCSSCGNMLLLAHQRSDKWVRYCLRLRYHLRGYVFPNCGAPWHVRSL